MILDSDDDEYTGKAGCPRIPAALGPYVSILQQALVLLAIACLFMAATIDADFPGWKFGLPAELHAQGLCGAHFPGLSIPSPGPVHSAPTAVNDDDKLNDDDAGSLMIQEEHHLQGVEVSIPSTVSYTRMFCNTFSLRLLHLN